MARTHPELVVNGAAQPRPNYLDRAVFNAECDRPPLPPSAPRLSLAGMDQLVTGRAYVAFP